MFAVLFSTFVNETREYFPLVDLSRPHRSSRTVLLHMAFGMRSDESETSLTADHALTEQHDLINGFRATHIPSSTLAAEGFGLVCLIPINLVKPCVGTLIWRARGCIRPSSMKKDETDIEAAPIAAPISFGRAYSLDVNFRHVTFTVTKPGGDTIQILKGECSSLKGLQCALWTLMCPERQQRKPLPTPRT